MRYAVRYWQLSPKSVASARSIAEQLLRKVFADASHRIANSLPPYVVCNNAVVTPVQLDAIGSSATSCARCARTFTGNSNDSTSPPRYVLVDISIRIPVDLIPADKREIEFVDDSTQRERSKPWTPDMIINNKAIMPPNTTEGTVASFDADAIARLLGSA